MARPKYYGRNSKTVINALEIIKNVVPGAQILTNYPMSDYATFKTGGKAAVFVKVSDYNEFIDLLDEFSKRNIEYIVLGKGSNILVSDLGIDVPVIVPAFDDIYLKDINCIYAYSGCSLRAIANFAAENSLTGFEFAAGIPGSLGGGLIMNAGAYGGELKDCVVEADVWNPESGFKTVAAEDADFGYRHSSFSENGDIVLGALIELNKGKSDDIYARMSELAEKRRSKQPLNLPSAGSTFKRPKDNFAGALIEKCGLKGVSIGGAQVSEKHGGFIVNTGNASSSDIYKLINHVIKTVEDRTGIRLEPEIKFIGDFSYIK